MNNMFEVFFQTRWIGVTIYYICRILDKCNKGKCLIISTVILRYDKIRMCLFDRNKICDFVHNKFYTEVIYPYTFCKTGVSSYLSTRQILLVSSIKLYMPTTTKTRLNIRHSIHVRIQHDKKYIIDCILNFLVLTLH